MTSPARCIRSVRAFHAYGSRVEIGSSSRALADRVRAGLPPGARAATTRARADLRLVLRGAGRCRCGRVHEIAALFRGRTLLAEGPESSVVEIALRTVKYFVVERSRSRVFVHAGAVAWQGRMILLPGRSMSGKTSLVRALVEAGAMYYSDEYAVLDRRGLVHPYPQPLGMREDGGWTQTDVPVRTLGWRPGVEPLPIGWVFLASYRRGARWRATPLSPGRSVFETLKHAVQMRRAPARTLDVLQRALATAEVSTVVRGEASEEAPHLLRRLASGSGN